MGTDVQAILEEYIAYSQERHKWQIAVKTRVAR